VWVQDEAHPEGGSWQSSAILMWSTLGFRAWASRTSPGEGSEPQRSLPDTRTSCMSAWQQPGQQGGGGSGAGGEGACSRASSST